MSELAALDNASIKLLISELVKLDQMYDVVIIDTGAGITDSVMEFVMMSPEVVLVVTPEPTSITDSYSLIKALARHSKYSSETTTVKVVANRVRGEQEAEMLFHKLETVVDKYLKIPIEYLGMVPQDEQLARAVMQQMPVSIENPGAKSAMAYEQLAAKLMNRETGKVQPRRGMAAFFTHIISRR